MRVQEWYDSKTRPYSRPDDTPILNRGEEWARNLPMACPHCGVTFYTWQPVLRPCEPYLTDPEPDVLAPGIAAGRRRTCKHPLCEDAEDRHQTSRGGHFALACAQKFTHTEQEEVKPKASGLRRI